MESDKEIENSCCNCQCLICMFGAPYSWCCRLECGEHEFCKDCEYD